MSQRSASCSCGRLRVEVVGNPVAVSVCHCLACQRRTGSVMSVQAAFDADKVTTAGEERTYVRRTADGEERRYHFCPQCGSTVFWDAPVAPGTTYVPVGAFADPGFPAPTTSVWNARRHPWLELPDVLAGDD